MRYTTNIFDKEIYEQLKRLPKPAQKMIWKAVRERLEVYPNDYGKPLVGNLKNHRRVRVSYYRIVYHIDEENKIVTIKAIDYRRDSYKKNN